MKKNKVVLLVCFLLLGSSPSVRAFSFDAMYGMHLVLYAVFVTAVVLECKVLYENMLLNKQIMAHNKTLRSVTVLS